MIIWMRVKVSVEGWYEYFDEMLRSKKVEENEIVVDKEMDKGSWSCLKVVSKN